MSACPSAAPRGGTLGRTVSVLVVLVCVLSSTIAFVWTAPEVSASAVVSTRTIGHSVQGRPIVAYRLGSPTAGTKAILIGQMHGDEPAGVLVARSLVTGSRAVGGIDLWVIPTMNPDGNARHTRQNAHGVDLNRNWNDIWVPLTGMYYSGPQPMSEPETRAVHDFISVIRPRYLVVLHQPLDGVDTTDGGRRDPAFRDRLARNLGLPLRAFNCFSICHGSMTGWFTARLPGAAITIEFPAAPSSSYLSGRAAPGIVSAMGGRFVALSSRNPIVSVESARARGSTVTLSGWAYDLDSPATSLTVALVDGTRTLVAAPTRILRTDVNAARGLSAYHGYSLSVNVPDGLHTFCIVAANVGSGSGSTKVCTATMRVRGAPYGVVDRIASPTDGSVEVSGWAFDPDVPANSSTISVSVDSVAAGSYAADLSRPDVNAALGISGNHGFDVVIDGIAQGTHTVCVTLINSGWQGAPNTALPCAPLTVS